MIKNNRFTDDTQDVRIERLVLLSANITEYGPLIGVPSFRTHAPSWAR